MKPTDEQIKEFWEWCLVKEENDNGYCWWRDGGGELVCAGYNCSPFIDLNNLFEYAVPKLFDTVGEIKAIGILIDWVKSQRRRISKGYWDLFWAIYEVIK